MVDEQKIRLQLEDLGVKPGAIDEFVNLYYNGIRDEKVEEKESTIDGLKIIMQYEQDPIAKARIAAMIISKEHEE